MIAPSRLSATFVVAPGSLEIDACRLISWHPIPLPGQHEAKQTQA